MRHGFLKMLFPVLIMMLNIDVQAQSSLLISSLETNQPLPYASVVNLTKQRLFFSNENGKLEHDFESGDSIIISHVGYIDFKSRYIENKSSTIYLALNTQLLSEVKLRPCTKEKVSEYSNLEGDSSGRLFGGLHCGENPLNSKVAILLEPAESNSYLESISIWLEKFYSAPRKSIQAPIKFSFYEKSDSTGLPGEILSERTLLYHPKKPGKQTINTDSLHIKIPANGLYLSIEFPVDEKYAYPVKLIYIETGKTNTTKFYGPRLAGIYSAKNVLAFYNYLQRNWHFAINRSKEDMYKTHGTIKFSYTVKSCAE